MSTVSKPVCATCGSADVSLEVTAMWDDTTGRIEVGDVCDKGHYCGSCKGECKLDWVDVPAPATDEGAPVLKRRITMSIKATPQTIAYMAIGAHSVIPQGGLPSKVADRFGGQLGFIDEAIAHADVLETLWENEYAERDDFDGVYAYDIAEALGARIGAILLEVGFVDAAYTEVHARELLNAACGLPPNLRAPLGDKVVTAHSGKIYSYGPRRGGPSPLTIVEMASHANAQFWSVYVWGDGMWEWVGDAKDEESAARFITMI